MKETITKTDHIYAGRVVTLDVHEVRLPNGEISRREQVVHPGAVAIVALDDQRQVLLVRQYRLPASSILVEIPAGTLNPQEDIYECARRELQEETGYHPGNLESLGGFYLAPGYSTEYIHLFLATNLVESALPGDDDEFIELTRVTLPEAVDMIERGAIQDCKTVSGILRVARRYGV